MKLSRRTVVGLAGLAVSGFLLTSGSRASSSAPMRFALILFAATSLTILTLRLTRTITLRDPRVGRRLLFLLAFATIVPAVLVGALGGVASWLGAESDRARAAAKSYESEAHRLRNELAAALEPAPLDSAEGTRDVAGRVGRVADAHARRGESCTVWISDGTWTLVAGDSVVSAAALRSWPSDSVGEVAIALVHEAPYVAARASSSDGRLAAMALVPADGALNKSIAEGVSASLELPRYTVVAGSKAVGDSTRAGKDGDRTIDLLRESPFRGFAAIHGRLWTGAEWVEADQFLSARTPFFAATSGLWRNGIVTPAAAVPLLLLALFLALGIRILVVNGQTLRAIGKSITSAVGALRGGVEALQAGRLEHRIAIAGADELWDVATGFNQAIEGLERAREVELEQARFRADLELARRIQARLLPTSQPEMADLDVSGLSLSALQVGGDYYDHVPLGDGRVALVLADVSGKGIPAALLMSAFRASLLGQLDAHSDPAQALANVNRFLHRSVEPGRFVTAFLAIVDGRTGRIEYCNAGHNPPFLVDGRDRATPLETGGLLLAMMEEATYQRGEAILEPGETLVIYSDGAVEAKNGDHAMWGEDRLVAQVRERAGESCAGAARGIASEIRAFEGAQGPSDDLTLLLARRRAAAAPDVKEVPSTDGA